MSAYQVKIEAVNTLSDPLKEQLSQLYFHYYAGSNLEVFLADLIKKDQIFLLYFYEQLVGFSTVQHYFISCPKGFTPLSPYQNSHELHIVFSGDTIVHAQHWGQQALAFAWVKYIAQLKQEDDKIPLYWFLLVKGFRTYKYLSAFAKSFYPNVQNDRADLKILADYLAQAQYGHLYNRHTGIVECPPTFGFLKHQWALPQQKDYTQASSAFFLEKNPQYLHGYELVCLCELERSNMKPLTERIFLSQFEE